MNEKAKVKRKLERVIRRKLPEYVWEDRYLQDVLDGYLSTKHDTTRREEEWDNLVVAAKDRMHLVEAAKAEALEEVTANIGGRETVVREATSRGHGREGGKLETTSFVGPKTTAMVQAMSEFFAGRAHQYRKVVEFRDNVLGSQLLTVDEAHKLLASYVARFLPPGLFSKWEIPIVGHTSELLEYDHGLDKEYVIDHRATVRVEPPGIILRVRYAHPHTPILDEDWIPTLSWFEDKALIPPNKRDTLAGVMPIVVRDNYTYPPLLWPGSVVDVLYDHAEELADAFDWPSREDAAWFILTGKAPEVCPIDARWKPKSGIRGQNPQWRIQLTIPPWLSEKEVLRAYRRMRRQIPKGAQLPKTTTPLEVAHFVWERERMNGYKRPPWRVLLEQWNEEHPGARFETYNNFSTYFARGAKAVKELNFSWPRPNEGDN